VSEQPDDSDISSSGQPPATPDTPDTPAAPANLPSTPWGPPSAYPSPAPEQPPTRATPDAGEITKPLPDPDAPPSYSVPPPYGTPDPSPSTPPPYGTPGPSPSTPPPYGTPEYGTPPPYGTPQAYGYPPPPPSTYGSPWMPVRSPEAASVRTQAIIAMICNIVLTMFCCTPFGLAGAITSGIAMGRVDTDLPRAKNLVAWGWGLLVASVVLGIAAIILLIMLGTFSEPRGVGGRGTL
jgi:hypothetical protein